MAQYPNSANLDWTDSTVPGQGDELVDQQDVNFAEHVNEIRGEVAAIASELGSNLRGPHSHVRARLENIETTKSSTSHTHDAAYIAKATLLAKGNILTATGTGVPAVLAAGANGSVVMFDSAQPTGLRAKALNHNTDLGGLTTGDPHTQYQTPARHDQHDHYNLPGVPPYPFVGMVVDSARPDVPPLWLEMNGQAVSRTTYADLFAAIDTQYGTGDGSTTFNVPNSRGRSRLTLDPTRTAFDTLGKTGGAESVVLTTAQLPSHNHSGPSHNHSFSDTSSSTTHSHTVSNPGDHRHGYQYGGGVAIYQIGNSSVVTKTGDYNTGYAGGHSHSVTGGGHTHTVSGTTGNGGTGVTGGTGGGGAHENMPPYMVFKSLIFAGA